MSIPLYHQAARDGFLELLKETTKRDTNSKDEDGMTPTLWAAFEGNVEALRLLVGRGGDPDKYDNYGNTALHLAAARGNIQVVTFLVNFGVNLYSLDIDTHTPQELAAINNADNVLRYLDAVVAKMEMEDPRKAGKLKEKALKESEKLKKNFKKIQQKADELILKEELELEQSIKRMQMEGDDTSEASDDGNNILNNNSRKRFSEIVSNNSVKSSISSSIGSSLFGRTISKKSAIGTVLRKINIKKEAMEQEKNNDQCIESKVRVSSSISSNDEKTNLLSNRHFKIRDTQEDGNMSVRKLKGLKRDSEILFVAPPPPSNDPSSKDSLSSLTKCHQNMMDNNKSTSNHKENLGIFERPGFGSVSFRDSVQTASLFSYDHLSNDVESSCEANDSALKLEHKLDSTSINEEESCGDEMNESIDDGISSHISSTISSRSHSEFGNSSHPGSSIGSAGSLVLRNRISIRNARTNTKLDQRDENNYAAVNIFLTTLGLRDLIPIFRSEKIDAHVLQYLEDDDLKDMSIPVGSRKRIMRAIAERRHDLENDRPIEDSRL